MLTSEELERYARHIVLRDVGGPGQAALKDARVLVIGAGGLGAPALMYLAAGVGTLGIVDDDTVSLSNLQRQIIHATPDVGLLKVASAETKLRALNPHVAVQTHAIRLNAANARQLIDGYDIVADGSDNFTTRYLVSDTCYHARKPLVTAALGMFDGSLTTIRAHEQGPDGTLNPTYRCLFPEPPPEGTVPACAEAGVLGALAGMMGSMMAMEVIREIVGFGDGLVGRLVMIDALSMRFETLRYSRDPANVLNGFRKGTVSLPFRGGWAAIGRPGGVVQSGLNPLQNAGKILVDIRIPEAKYQESFASQMQVTSGIFCSMPLIGRAARHRLQ